VLIGSGVIASAGSHPIAGAASPQHAAHVFRWVMPAAALFQALRFPLMTQLKEVPLRTAPATVAIDWGQIDRTRHIPVMFEIELSSDWFADYSRTGCRAMKVDPLSAANQS
jgi:hypothetical protein